MNIFKFSLSGLFVFFSLFLFSITDAATTPAKVVQPPATKTQGVLVATVNIKAAKIVFQDGKNFKISFTLTNQEGIQTGVKYGIKLFTDDKNQSLVDEKIYDESLTLSENSSVSREVTYTPPSILDGNFVILLQAKNESNFPFGSFIVGKIKLNASLKWVQILPESCYLQMAGDKAANHFTLTQNVLISPFQNLLLNCSAVNTSNGPVSVVPSFDTRYSGSFGDYAPQSGGSEDPISFAKGEKKNISIMLPKGDIAKAYSAKVSLTDGQNYSNSISLGYIIKGISATIQKVSLDKDFYKAGDTAQLSLIWFGSDFDTNSPQVKVDTSITNNRNWLCASVDTQTISKDKNNPANVLSIPIKNTCENPHVKISLSDMNGTVLDQKEFTFQSSSTDNSARNKINRTYAVGSIIVFVIIAMIGVYISRKKKINNVTM